MFIRIKPVIPQYGREKNREGKGILRELLGQGKTLDEEYNMVNAIYLDCHPLPPQ